MRAIIFLNGNKVSEKDIRKIDFSGALIVCADGAYSYLKGKVKPSVVLGDFDSFPLDEVESGVKTVVFPPEKDFTDGHLAVEYAINSGAETIEIYGAFGGRPDHCYSNYSLLYQAKRRGVKASLVGENYVVTLEDGMVERKVRKGATVSLVPFLETSHILITEGLKYPMREVTLGREHVLGISNEATSERIKFECKGELLVFIQNE